MPPHVRAAARPPAAVAIAAALATVLAGCGGGTGKEAGSTPSPTATSTPDGLAPEVARANPLGEWKPVAPAPLTARHSSIAVWTGSEVVVLGGTEGVNHPQDGAVYDPDADSWRTVAPAPVSLQDASVVAIGGTAYVLTRSKAEERDAPRFYAYSLDANTWRLLATPPVDRPADWVFRLAVAGDRIVAWNPAPAKEAGRRAGLFYSPATDSWAGMSADPFGRSAHREMVGLPDGKIAYFGVQPWEPGVVAGTAVAREPGRFYRAAVLDPDAGTRWRKLPNSGLGLRKEPGAWAAAGDVLVAADAGVGASVLRSNGAPAPEGEPVPTGGTLDPTGGIWSTLPVRPEAAGTPPLWANASGGGVTVRHGWAFDAGRGTWAQVPPLTANDAPLEEPAVVWAGDRLFAFGGHVPAVGDYSGLLKDAWVWQPPPASGPASPVRAVAEQPDDPAAHVWSDLAAAPLRPWLQTVTVPIGKEIVVFGGDTACPPGTQCPAPRVKSGRGGAAYDPGRDRWRALAAPTFSLYHASAVAIGRTVYVLAPENNADRLPEFYAFSLETDTWRRLPDPPIGPNVGTPAAISAAGDQLVAWDRFPTKHEPTDLRYDPAQDQWSTVPADPWGIGQERTVLGLPDGRAVAVSAPLPAMLDASGLRPPRFWRAAVLDAEAEAWAKLPPSGLAVSPIGSPGHGRWVWAGGRIVNPEVGTVPAAASSTGMLVGGPAALPTGGVLDPVAQAWSTLPGRPERVGEVRGATDPIAWATAAGGDAAVLRGWIYEVRRRQWTEVPVLPTAPDGLVDPAVAAVDGRLFVWGRTQSLFAPGQKADVEGVEGWVLRRPESGSDE